jgi:hypothetical protein
VLSSRAIVAFRTLMSRSAAGLAAVLVCMAVLAAAPADAAAAKRKSRPSVPPDLKIVSVTALPDPFVPGAGALDMRVEIELPDEVGAGTLLDVTALIESPSKRSIAFLNNRQAVETHAGVPAAAPGVKPHVSIVLSWDGMDQHGQAVLSGRFSYEIRAKLLTVGDRGARTTMTSWPKHGAIAVLEPLGRPDPAP